MSAAQTLGVLLFLIWMYSAWRYYPGPMRISLPKVLDDKRQVGWVCLISAVTLFVIDVGGGRATFLSNVALSLATIAVTVLLLDSLAEERDRKTYKQLTIHQLGSNVNDAALEALRIARKQEHRWHADGSLCKISLAGANLEKANLSGAVLISTALIETNLNSVVLFEADLSCALLHEARLNSANLSGAIATKARLNNARLVRAELHFTNLIKADLHGAWLHRANLVGAMLAGSNLSWARLIGADLRGADLTGAIMSQTDLSGAKMSQTTVEGVIFDELTKWPADFDPLQAGARCVSADEIVEELARRFPPWYYVP